MKLGNRYTDAIIIVIAIAGLVFYYRYRSKRKPVKSRYIESLINLTNHPKWDSYPAVSPDGSQIAFISIRDGRGNDYTTYELYLMDIYNRHVRRLTHNNFEENSPSWSPDGEKIIYNSMRDGYNKLCIFDLNLMEEQIFFNQDHEHVQYPSWSSDGSWITFSGKNIIGRSDGYDIFKKNVINGNIINLTKFRDTDTAPSWSPNGKEICFMSNRDGNREIYTMNSDGSNQVNISNDPAEDSNPSFSPDGKHIVFHTTRNGNYDLYIMDKDGANVKKLTNYYRKDMLASWMPDNQSIVFTSRRSGGGDLFLMELKGLTQELEYSHVNKMNSVCIYNGLSVRAKPNKKAKRLSSIYLWESVNWNGKSIADSLDENIKYLHVRLSDNTTGWAQEWGIVTHASVGAIMEDTPICRRPDLITITKKAFKFMDIVAIQEYKDGWAQVIGEGRKKMGWIKENIITTTKTNVTSAIFIGSKMKEIKGLSEEDKFRSIVDNTSFPNSYFIQKILKKIESEKSETLSSGIPSDTIRPPDTVKSGQKPVNLTMHPMWDAYPSVSPDGSKIAFVSNRHGEGTELYIMDIRGNLIRRITNNSVEETSPSWSPDGKKIVFHTKSQDYDELFIIDINTLKQEKIFSRMYSDVDDPSWSPDGLWIAFTCADIDGQKSGTDIHILNISNGYVINLTKTDDYELQPSWSPNGEELLFVSYRDNNYELYVMNIDGSNQKNLSHNPAHEKSPRFSPDGNHILFVSTRNENDELYMMEKDGTNVKRLTHHPTQDLRPSWLPDMSGIVYYSNQMGNGEIFKMKLIDFIPKVKPKTESSSIDTITPDISKLDLQIEALKIGENVLINSSFERDPRATYPYWYKSDGKGSDIIYKWSREYAKTGYNSLFLSSNNTGKENASLKTQYTFYMGYDYTLEVSYMTTSNTKVQFGLIFFNETDRILKSFMTSSLSPLEKFEWNTNEIFIKSEMIPTEAVKMQIVLIHCLSKPKGIRTGVYFDDVYLVRSLSEKGSK